MSFDPKSRRQFLGSAGKLALSLPFLPSLLKDAAAAPTWTPGGLVAIVIRNGAQRMDWEPYVFNQLALAGDGGQSGQEVRAAPFAQANRLGINNIIHDSMPGLTPQLRDQMTLLMGLDSASTAAGHGPTSLGAVGDYPSVDQLIAASAASLQRIYGGCEPVTRSFHLATMYGPYSGASESFRRVGLSGPLTKVPALDDVIAAYDLLVAGGSPAVRDRSDKALSLIAAETQLLKQRASGADYRLAEQYFDMVSGLRQKILSACGVTPNLSGLMSRPVIPFSPNSDFYAGVHVDLAVTALRLGATRAVTIYIQGRDIYSAGSWHTDSHSEQASVPAFRDMQRWVVEKYFIPIMQKLSSFGMLQDSLVYLGNDISHPRNHSTTNMPILLGGTAGGSIQPGRVISYMRQGQNVPLPGDPGYSRGALMNQFFDSILQSNLFGLTPADYALSGEPGYGRRDHPTLPAAQYVAVRPHAGRPLPQLAG